LPDIESPILEARRRAQDQWGADGLPQLVSGVVWVLWGFSVGHLLPQSSFFLVLLLLLLSVSALVVLRGREIIEWLKARVTYPRTGYVGPPYSPDHSSRRAGFTRYSLLDGEAQRQPEVVGIRKNRNLRGLIFGVLGAAVLLIQVFIENQWVSMMALVALGLCSWLVAPRRSRLLWVPGVPSLGLLMFALKTGPERRAGFLIVGLGILFVLEGTITLVGYLRRNRLPHA